MPGTLNQIDPPKAGQDSRGLWRIVAELVKLYNALLKCEVVTDSGQNRLQITESNAKLEVNAKAGAGTAAAALRPLQLVKTSESSIRIILGNLGTEPAEEFHAGDTPPLLFTGLVDGDLFYAEVIWDAVGLSYTHRHVKKGTPPDTLDERVADGGGLVAFRYLFGSVNITSAVLTAANSAFGPLTVTVYSLWYTFPRRYKILWNAPPS